MLLVLLGALCISWAPILVKFSQLDPSSLAFFRCFFAFLILLPFFGWKKESGQAPLDKHSSLPIVFGAIFFALDLFCWHRSIYLVGAGMATILGNSQAFYLALVGKLFFGEKLKWRFYVGLLLAFVGITILVDPFSSDQIRSEDYFMGIFFGLATGLFYSGYIVCLRLGQSNLNRLRPAKKLGLVSATTALVVLPVSFFDQGLQFPQGGSQWTFTLLVAFVPQVMGWMFITNGLPKIPISKSGAILLLQPVLATLLGMLIFREQLSHFQLMGAAITILAIYLANTSKQKKLTQDPLPEK